MMTVDKESLQNRQPVATAEKGAVTAFTVVLLPALFVAGLLIVQLGTMFSDYRHQVSNAQAAARAGLNLDDDNSRILDQTPDGFKDGTWGGILLAAATDRVNQWCAAAVVGVNTTPCGTGGVTVEATGPRTIAVTISYTSRSFMPGVSPGTIDAIGRATR